MPINSTFGAASKRGFGGGGSNSELLFTQNQAAASIYDNGKSFFVNGLRGSLSSTTGTLVKFKAPSPIGSGTLRFALQSGGGGGPLDDGDGATASGSGAYSEVIFNETTFYSIKKKTLVLALGFTCDGYGNNTGFHSSKVYTGIVDYSSVRASYLNTNVGNSQSGYAGYGAVDSVLYVEETSEIILISQGGFASTNYDGGPAGTAKGYANPNFGYTRNTADGIAQYPRSTHGVMNPSYWTNNSIASTSRGGPYSNAGRGGAAHRSDGDIAAFFMQLN